MKGLVRAVDIRESPVVSRLTAASPKILTVGVAFYTE
jgi:hypothetical protein